MERNDCEKRIIVGDTIGEVVPPEWFFHSYKIFHERLTDPDYPCYFGAFAENNSDLYYSFVDPDFSSHLPQVVRKFIEVSSQFVGRRNNLAVFFKPEPESEQVTHDDRKKRTWEILQHLHDNDPEPWSDAAPADPADHSWEFCFAGTLFFIVALSSTYVLRKSRNMGPGLILLFQPRDVFVDPYTGENIGHAARDAIRERLRHWDDIEVHPDLGVFTDPRKNEWKQYYLSDDMKPETGGCPFRTRNLKSRAASEDP
ncbi:MAG TPA: YqcI/YcgG family protein [Bryobacteraceae bacterium]